MKPTLREEGADRPCSSEGTPACRGYPSEKETGKSHGGPKLVGNKRGFSSLTSYEGEWPSHPIHIFP